MRPQLIATAVACLYERMIATGGRLHLHIVGIVLHQPRARHDTVNLAIRTIILASRDRRVERAWSIRVDVGVPCEYWL